MAADDMAIRQALGSMSMPSYRDRLTYTAWLTRGFVELATAVSYCSFIEARW